MTPAPVTGRPRPPRNRRSFGSDVGLLLFGIGSGFVLSGGQEFGQGLSFTFRVLPRDIHDTKRFGQPARTVKQPLGLAGHIGFLEVVDKLNGLLALCLAHRIENAGLGDSAEIVVDGRFPACCHHVESDGTSQDIGLVEPAANTMRGDVTLIIAIGRLVERVDRRRCTMSEQRGLLIPVKPREDVQRSASSLGRRAFHPLCRTSMASAEALSFRPGACAGNVGVRIAISRQLLEDAN